MESGDSLRSDLLPDACLGDTEDHVEDVLADTEESELLLPNEYRQEENHETTPRSSSTETTAWTIMILAMVVVSLCLNIMLMLSAELVAVVAGVAASSIAITVGVAQLRLQDIDTLVDVHNDLREDVNTISTQNHRLEAKVTEFQTKVFSLKDTEKRLRTLTKDQELNLPKLMDLVEEGKLVAMEMKSTLRTDLITELMDTIFKGERDEDGQIEDKEIRRLVTYMRGLPAVKVNEVLLKKAIKRDRSIFALMNLVMDIGRLGGQEGDRIFILDENSVELHGRVAGIQSAVSACVSSKASLG